MGPSNRARRALDQVTPGSHRNKKWRRVSAALAALIGGGLISVAGTTAPARAAGNEAPAVPVLHWRSCDDGFQCAVARVPLNYRRPGGTTIGIAVIRHLAADPSKRLGSLFFNGGGPGQQVVGFPSEYPMFPAALRSRYDIVTFDPRGLGSSTPVHCFASATGERQLLSNLPPFFPVGGNQDATWERIWAQFDEQCAAHGGPLIDHDTTADEARDMNLLREAVRDPVLNYVGESYGTLLGATYANLFPDTVGRMLLDGNVNAAAWTTASRDTPQWLRIGRDKASAEVMRDFLDLCGSTSTARCAFSAGSPAATTAKFAALLARLDQHPVTAGTPPQTYSYAAAVASVPVATVATWQQGARLLQQLWLASSSPSRSSPASASNLIGYDGHAEWQLGILCADAPDPSDAAAYPAIARTAEQSYGGFGIEYTWQSEECANWPAAAGQDRYSGPWNRVTKNTILLFGNTGDPDTSYQSSVALSHELARARLLTVDGYGHTEQSNPSSCAEAYGIRYLLSGALPPKGTVCPQNATPFPAGTGN
jgi:pimeloyl-ACP methyl ester carboxylesterase